METIVQFLFEQMPIKLRSLKMIALDENKLFLVLLVHKYNINHEFQRSHAIYQSSISVSQFVFFGIDYTKLMCQVWSSTNK